MTTPSAADRERLLGCLRSITPGPAAHATASEVLDDVLRAYGDLSTDAVCRIVTAYARAHARELRSVLARREGDRRRPRLFSDAAIFCVLERLEHDRYALRRGWVPAHDPAELRRVADIWGIRLGV
jgi:hypothetical protein